jgi:hypothetical protein
MRCLIAVSIRGLLHASECACGITTQWAVEIRNFDGSCIRDFPHFRRRPRGVAVVEGRGLEDPSPGFRVFFFPREQQAYLNHPSMSPPSIFGLMLSPSLSFEFQPASKWWAYCANSESLSGIARCDYRARIELRSNRRRKRTSRPFCMFCPSGYRLPLVVLEQTGMRLGELEGLSWGDLDEERLCWRVSEAVSKTRHARWVPVPPELFQAVTRLVAREDRTPERRIFQGFGGDRFRTAVTRACTAAGVPAFSPHDLRHRRISLLHLSGVPWARIGEHVGQRSLRVTADTYSHVLVDEAELDYAQLLKRV